MMLLAWLGVAQAEPDPVGEWEFVSERPDRSLRLWIGTNGEWHLDDLQRHVQSPVDHP